MLQKALWIVIIIGLVVAAGCVTVEQKEPTPEGLKTITVIDRIITPESLCGCAILTSDGTALDVQYYKDCVKLRPGHTYDVIIGNSVCDITSVVKEVG